MKCSRWLKESWRTTIICSFAFQNTPLYWQLLERCIFILRPCLTMRPAIFRSFSLMVSACIFLHLPIRHNLRNKLNMLLAMAATWSRLSFTIRVWLLILRKPNEFLDSFIRFSILPRLQYNSTQIIHYTVMNNLGWMGRNSSGSLCWCDGSVELSVRKKPRKGLGGTLEVVKRLVKVIWHIKMSLHYARRAVLLDFWWLGCGYAFMKGIQLDVVEFRSVGRVPVAFRVINPWLA